MSTDLGQSALDHIFDVEFPIAKLAYCSTGQFFSPTLIQLNTLMAPCRPLERARLLQALLAIRDTTEMTVAVVQITRFFPFFTASVATIRGVVIRTWVNWPLHIEYALIFIEDEFTLSDHELFTVFDQDVHFVERVSDCTVAQACFFEWGWCSLDYHTLLESLLKDILVSDQFGQILDFTLLILR